VRASSCWPPCRHDLSMQQHTHLGYLWPGVHIWLHFGRHVHFQGKFLLLSLCVMDAISIYMPVCVCVCVCVCARARERFCGPFPLNASVFCLHNGVHMYVM
jgi:hypothetical protein